MASWPFFGDTVVIIGETPSDQSLTHKLPDADNGNTGSEPRGMTHFLTGHDLLMCLQRDLSSMLVPPLYRNPVNPPMTL